MRRLQRLSVETERAHAQAAERNRELQEQFIDITCHELRNPLNAIYNSAVLLGESLTRIEANLDSLRRNGTQHPGLEQMIDELRDDIDSTKTIVLCAKHQKRITDGKHLSQSLTKNVPLTCSLPRCTQRVQAQRRTHHARYR
jgi:light-regulated signal transduction histidine kinase (bacteriophytochrome)